MSLEADTVMYLGWPLTVLLYIISEKKIIFLFPAVLSCIFTSHGFKGEAADLNKELCCGETCNVQKVLPQVRTL